MLVHTWAAEGPAHKFVGKTFAAPLVSEQLAQMTNMRAIPLMCLCDDRKKSLASARGHNRWRMGPCSSALDTVEISEAQRAKIYSGNAERIFKLA